MAFVAVFSLLWSIFVVCVSEITVALNKCSLIEKLLFASLASIVAVLAYVVFVFSVYCRHKERCTGNRDFKKPVLSSPGCSSMIIYEIPSLLDVS